MPRRDAHVDAELRTRAPRKDSTQNAAREVEFASQSTSERGRGPGSLRIRFAFIVISVYVVAAVIGPWLVEFDPIATDTGNRLLPPGARQSDGTLSLFGTDQVGQDLFGQTLQGARVSMTVGIVTLTVAGTVGIVIGLIAGYVGGRLDGLLMRIADVQLAFPSILLAIFIAALLGPSVVNLIVVLSITKWVIFARVTRSQVLTIKEREYVDASRTFGAGALHILRRGILPAVVAPVLVVATVEIGNVILAEAALSFLGLGVPANVPSWGGTISNGRNHLTQAWWIATIPGIVLSLLVVSFGILGDALRDRFDPQMRSI